MRIGMFQQFQRFCLHISGMFFCRRDIGDDGDNGVEGRMLGSTSL